MAKIPMKPPMPKMVSPRKQMAASASTPVLGVDGMKRGGKVKKSKGMKSGGRC